MLYHKHSRVIVQLELFETSKNSSPDLYSEQVAIGSRKYLGSKHRLLDFIGPTILAQVPHIGTFLDGFSGTGVVASWLRPHVQKTIVNDLLRSNYVVNRAYLASTERNVDQSKILRFLSELNTLQPIEGYVYRNYGGTYFTIRNAGMIDSVRERIAEHAQAGECTAQEECVLLTSLLYAVDKVANTVGQYDAFLKHLGLDSYDETGKHLIDANVYKPLTLRMPRLDLLGRAEVHNEDINVLIRNISGDVLYLDPPYNTRQYVDCYHVLENIVRWDKPPLYGKTRKFERSGLKSRYSRRKQVLAAFSDVVEQADFKHVFVSYNDEGILSADAITAVLERRGLVSLHQREYPVFGNGAGRSRKRLVCERLFHCAVC